MLFLIYDCFKKTLINEKQKWVFCTLYTEEIVTMVANLLFL